MADRPAAGGDLVQASAALSSARKNAATGKAHARIDDALGDRGIAEDEQHRVDLARIAARAAFGVRDPACELTNEPEPRRLFAPPSGSVLEREKRPRPGSRRVDPLDKAGRIRPA